SDRCSPRRSWPMSRMYTEDSCRLPMPMRAAPALRLSMSCSRLTYRDFVPCARAFSCIIHRMRDVFIVPGVPATRTVLPFGIPPPELPMPAAPRGRSSSELDALGQEFQTFRHLLRPREAKEVEGELKELARTRDRDAMVALRRRLRALSLEAAFWSELASGAKESNAIALVILRKGKEVLAKAGETAYVDDPAVAEMIQRESEKRSKATF